MAVLITGATGFLGTQLAVRFLNEGYDVLATDFTEPSDETSAARGLRRPMHLCKACAA